MNTGNIIGAILIVGLGGAAAYFGLQYARAGQQGYSPLGQPAAQLPPQRNVDQVRTGTAPQQQQPGDNTAAQVAAWGAVALNLFGQAATVYEQHWGKGS